MGVKELAPCGAPGFAPVSASALRRDAESRQQPFLDAVHDLCAIESPAGYAPGVSEAADWIAAWGRARGWSARSWPDAEAGDGAIVSAAGGAPNGLRVMIVTHHDTAYPIGAVQERPPRREGGRLLGPGVIDAKGGALLALFSIALLASHGLLGPFSRISLLSTPDEAGTRRVAVAMIEALGNGYDVALSTAAAKRGDDGIVSSGAAAMDEVIHTCGRALGMQTAVAATGLSALGADCAARGLPVLDRLGPAGGMARGQGEYLTVASVTPRMTLLAMVLHALAMSGLRP